MMDLIISQIIGGLGNQMFQFAAGRALSIERGLPLHLDISGFSNYDLHQGFELARVFDGQFEIATEAEVRSTLGWQFSPTIRRVVKRSSMSRFRCASMVVEPHFQYWMGFNNAPSNCYLMGYWQSQKYFEKYASVIRSDFAFRSPSEGKNETTVRKINSVNAVSVHVRRGDYITNKKNNEVHGLCSLEYYRTAIKYVADRVSRPHFFVFSDDTDWARYNVKCDFPCTYVDENHGCESYNDMRLMSLCQHNIVANSSFGWWGAWLNRNQTKLVITPRKWFRKDIETKDLIPAQWIAL